MSVPDSTNPFDSLVSGISGEERKALLEKLQKTANNVETQTLEAPLPADEKGGMSLTVELKQESFLYRFWVWIRSLFSGMSSAETYNADKVSGIASDISRTYTGLIDYPHAYLLTPFYEKLKELKICADFFRPYIGKIEEDPGAFYVFLGVFLAQEITNQMNEEADPFIYPVTPEVTKEYRSALLRKMDEILKNIPAESKQAMYRAVCSIEWLRQFTRLPFDRFLDLFTNLLENTYVCTFDNAESVVDAFTKVLSAGKGISGEELEALYLFSNPGNDPEALDTFLGKAETQLSVMHIFITTVPMRLIARVIYNDCRWAPELFGGAEDWFVKYKEQWKKVFDRRWNSWTQACKKEEQRIALKNKFGLESFPMLPYRPWSQMWGGMIFHFELTGGFLYWFFTNQYAEVLKVLKSLLLEGLFMYNENKEELSTAMNDFSRIEFELKQFTKRLAPNGETGVIFDKLASEHLRTLQGQNKIDSMILAAENEVKNFETQFCAACRTFLQILKGIFSENNDKRYGPLKNLQTARSSNGRNLYDELQSLKAKLADTLDMIGQIEVIDASGRQE